jgi:hypothetical protein
MAFLRLLTNPPDVDGATTACLTPTLAPPLFLVVPVVLVGAVGVVSSATSEDNASMRFGFHKQTMMCHLLLCAFVEHLLPWLSVRLQLTLQWVWREIHQ